MTDLLGDPLRVLQRVLLQLPALLVAVTVHEVAHAVVADRLGDPTARRLGRITLNPLPHIDPLGAISLVLAGFGWAKPVPVDARNFSHPVRDMFWVAIAGPIANFLAAFVAVVLYLALRRSGAVPGHLQPDSDSSARRWALPPLSPAEGGRRPSAHARELRHADPPPARLQRRHRTHRQPRYRLGRTLHDRSGPHSRLSRHSKAPGPFSPGA